MTEIHELLGRDLDPIDDVRRKFEASYAENYHNPINGDWISDDYWDIIDLTTQPGELTEIESARLNRMISRLNGKYEHIQRRLGDSSLLGAYVDVAEQVSAINNTRDSQVAIEPMHGAPKEALPEIKSWITRGNFLSKRGWDVAIGLPDESGVSFGSYNTQARFCFDVASRLGGITIHSEWLSQEA